MAEQKSEVYTGKVYTGKVEGVKEVAEKITEMRKRLTTIQESFEKSKTLGEDLTSFLLDVEQSTNDLDFLITQVKAEEDDLPAGADSLDVALSIAETIEIAVDVTPDILLRAKLLALAAAIRREKVLNPCSDFFQTDLLAIANIN